MFSYFLALFCVHGLCLVLLVLVLFVVLYAFIACCLHVLDILMFVAEAIKISYFPVHPMKTGHCVPYDEISSGPHTQSMLINVNPWHCECRMEPYNEFFLRNIYIPGVEIALALCRLETLLLSFPWWWFQLFRSGFFYVYYMMSGIG